MTPDHKFAVTKTAEKLVPQGANLPLFEALYLAASTKTVPANRRFYLEGFMAVDLDTGFFVRLEGFLNGVRPGRITTGKITAMEGTVDERISTQLNLKIF